MFWIDFSAVTGMEIGSSRVDLTISGKAVVVA